MAIKDFRYLIQGLKEYNDLASILVRSVPNCVGCNKDETIEVSARFIIDIYDTLQNLLEAEDGD